MASENSLTPIIEASRKMSADGSLAIYNLTKGVDFSKPRKVADALAAVFYEKDAINWFKVDGDHVEFNPTYKVRILLAEDHNKLLGETVDELLGDLKKKELNKEFVQQIKDQSVSLGKMQAAMATNAFSAFLAKKFNRRVDKVEVEDDLFTDILEALEIRTPSNEDLIDWEHLPL